MSGICGVLDQVDPIAEADLARFADALTHRGPDRRELLVDGGVGLGFRGSTIPVHGGDATSPLSFGGPDGQRYWIAFDGELYNVRELRRDLEGLGHVFRTELDGETVAAAYAQWDVACLLRFNGKWALALWDRENRRLFMARDRFGEKPLHFMIGGSRLAFASEMKAFLDLAGFTPALDQDSARVAIAHGLAVDGTQDATIMQGVRRLAPGHALTIDSAGRIVLTRWWDGKAHLPAVPASYPDQVAGFRALFQDAVALRSRAPLAVCLGGGLGSGAVAACLTGSRQAVFADFPGCAKDERDFGLRMAAHIGADSRQLVFSPEDVANAWVDSVWATEGLESGMTAPLWCLFREMRSHGALAAIGGQCADALLCGHPRHLDWPMHQVNDLLFDEFQRTRLPGLLRLYDRCAMAHGVELRMPFLDWRLVAFASALPPEAKIGQGFTQRVLRDAMAGILPEPIRLRRTKVGFDDTQALLNGCLAPLVRRAVDHPLWVDSPLWNGPVLRDQILARTTAQAWTEADSAVWPMINLVLWQMLFIERRTPALLWG